MPHLQKAAQKEQSQAKRWYSCNPSIWKVEELKVIYPDGKQVGYLNYVPNI